MKRSRMLILSVVAVLLLALLAACGGDDDQPSSTESAGQATTSTAVTPTSEGASTSAEETSPPDEPTATETADEAQDEPTEASESDETATTDDADEPTAAADESDDRLVGTASVEDDSDDVTNILMQDPDEPMPGIDLQSVRLESDGDQIVATITTAGDIAAELSDDLDVDFDVHIWQDGTPIYALSFHHYGSDDWIATVTDFTVGPMGDEETIDTEITVTDTSLSAAFPTSMLSELETPFEWYSSVMLYESGNLIGPDTWFDGAPENVLTLLADPDEFMEFPQ